MTRRGQRKLLIAAGAAVLTVAVALVLVALRDTIVFFYSPSELATAQVGPGTPFRLGGLVEEGSVVKLDGGIVEFRVTDLEATLPVHFAGILPDLFREGQGIVAQGRLGTNGIFVADEVLAKHDETYMPPEVAEALKGKGEWRGDETNEM